jgi:AcrR family transcriptional regulator
MTRAPIKRWQRRPDARRVELADAALRLFSERGITATRLEDVAEVAGVSKATVYKYFDSKEALVEYAIRSRLTSLVGQLEELAGDVGGPASARLRIVLRRAWSYWVSPEAGRLLRLVLGELSSISPELVRAWADDGPARGWRVVESLIREGVEAGEFRRDVDAAVAARFVTSGLLMQANLRVHLGIGDLSPERLVDSTIETFLNGIRAPFG